MSVYPDITEYEIVILTDKSMKLFSVFNKKGKCMFIFIEKVSELGRIVEVDSTQFMWLNMHRAEGKLLSLVGGLP